MTEPSNTLYALRDIQEQEHRRALLQSSHIAPLTEYVNRLRSQSGHGRGIPYFDPLDGGTSASLLFLLEAPGRKAVDSGFISRNNPDPSARNMAQILVECDIPREETVLWNIVPWFVGDQTRIRPVNQKDVIAAIAPLKNLRPLLPRVQVVILVGRKAQRAHLAIEELFQTPVLECWHPSQRSLNVWPQKRDEIKTVFRRAVRLATH